MSFDGLVALTEMMAVYGDGSAKRTYPMPSDSRASSWSLSRPVLGCPLLGDGAGVSGASSASRRRLQITVRVTKHTRTMAPAIAHTATSPSMPSLLSLVPGDVTTTLGSADKSSVAALASSRRLRSRDIGLILC
jgi:hypothetical protein